MTEISSEHLCKGIFQPAKTVPCNLQAVRPEKYSKLHILQCKKLHQQWQGISVTAPASGSPIASSASEDPELPVHMCCSLDKAEYYTVITAGRLLKEHLDLVPCMLQGQCTHANAYGYIA